MKSEDVTFWQMVKHIFGFHTWSEWRTWRDPEWGPNPPPVIYKNCEICGKEYIAKYGIDF